MVMQFFGQMEAQAVQPVQDSLLQSSAIRHLLLISEFSVSAEFS
jgi:hypothetical protein